MILFPGRTGSSFLISCLGSHPQVVAEGERLVGIPTNEQSSWIRSYLDAPRDARVRAVGFKTKLKDVWDLGAFADLLRASRVRILLLRRRNLVKLAVSTLNARRVHAMTGRWNRGTDAPPLGPLEVDAETLASTIARCAHSQDEVDAYVRRLALPTMSLDYEELLADRVAWLRSVTDFLEVDALPLEGGFVKSTDDDLSVALADFARIRTAFRGTPREVDFEA